MDRVMLARLFGIVFLVVGVLGFFMNPLFGVFETDAMQNSLHIVIGLAGLYLSMQGETGAMTYGKLFGIGMAVITVLGFVLPGGDILGLFRVNMADNYLHVVLSVALLYLGFARIRTK
ncbi:MAG: hypothetical protein UZ21_OP11001000707 [Microgenomates bacterium OLB22]|nr:MAG: hypothetical protein UZ21_OP11001000707 [Microgenomates bacterium OLB22]